MLRDRNKDGKTAELSATEIGPIIKICPVCGIHAPITAAACVNCDHMYRTKATDLQEMSQAQEGHPMYFPAASPQNLRRGRLSKRFRAATILVFTFLVLLLAALIIAIYHSQLRK